jgi:hypothetical protein
MILVIVTVSLSDKANYVYIQSYLIQLLLMTFIFYFNDQLNVR